MKNKVDEAFHFVCGVFVSFFVFGWGGGGGGV